MLISYATGRKEVVVWSGLIGVWPTILCSAVPIGVLAIALYILVKFGYEFKADLSTKKVEVTHKETPTKRKH